MSPWDFQRWLTDSTWAVFGGSSSAAATVPTGPTGWLRSAGTAGFGLAAARARFDQPGFAAEEQCSAGSFDGQASL